MPGISAPTVSLLRGQYLLTRMSSVEGARVQVTAVGVRDSDAARVSGAWAVTGTPTTGTPPWPAAPAPLRPRSPFAEAEWRRPTEVSKRLPGLLSSARPAVSSARVRGVCSVPHPGPGLRDVRRR